MIGIKFTGATVFVENKLNKLNDDKFVRTTPMNEFTTEQFAPSNSMNSVGLLIKPGIKHWLTMGSVHRIVTY